MTLDLRVYLYDSANPPAGYSPFEDGTVKGTLPSNALSLNDIEDGTALTSGRIQVLPGATGFGFPQISAFFQQGAGDGAIYRGKRVQPRDIDLPLRFEGSTSEVLRAKIERFLALIQSGTLNLRVQSGSNSYATAWELYGVKWVGGGQWAMGSDDIDVDGNAMQTVITLRAPDPMWTRIDTSGSNPADYYAAVDPRQNLIPNPSFDAAFTGPTAWVGTSGLATLTRQTTYYYDPAYALQIVWTTQNNGSVFSPSFTTVPGQTYQVVLWMMTTTAGQPLLKLSAQTSGGAVISSVNQTSWGTAGAWTSLTLNFVATTATSLVTLQPITYGTAFTMYLDFAGAYLASGSQSNIGTTQVITQNDAPFYPVAVVSGPGDSFRIENPDTGEFVEYLPAIPYGTTIYLDFKKQTIVDQNGNNLYAQLTPGSRFFAIDPSALSQQLKTTYRSGSAASSKRNYVTNPQFKTNTTGWTLNGMNANSANVAMVGSPNYGLKLTGGYSTTYTTGNKPKATTATLTGLVVGQTYTMHMNGTQGPANSAYYPPTSGYFTSTQLGTVGVTQSGSTAGNSLTYTPSSTFSYVFTFTAKATTATVAVSPPYRIWSDPGNTPNAYYVYNDYTINYVHLIDGTGGPFTGDNANSQTYTYSWTGTANNSQSLAVINAVANAASSLRSFFRRRTWSVV